MIDLETPCSRRRLGVADALEGVVRPAGIQQHFFPSSKRTHFRFEHNSLFVEFVVVVIICRICCLDCPALQNAQQEQ